MLRSFACCWCARSCADGYPARTESPCPSRYRRIRFIIPDKRFLFWIPSSTYVLDARVASNRRFDTIFVFVPDYCVLRHFSRLRSHASPFWQQARAGDQRLKNVPPLGEAYSPTRRPRIPVRFSRAYHAHLLLQVPRIVYVRQGDPGTQEFIASMIESPVQRELGLSVGGDNCVA